MRVHVEPSQRSCTLRRAQEAQLLAAQLDDPVAKAATLKIAQEYERLAARAANREMVKK
jgi:hypothetical protein